LRLAGLVDRFELTRYGAVAALADGPDRLKEKRKQMDAPAGLDQAKMDAFNQKANNDFTAGLVTVMCSLGDELGLFRILAEEGPMTSGELATRAAVNERYTREWLAALACAGYLEYTPIDTRFTLPPEHAPTLAEEGSLPFIGGLYQLFPALLAVHDQIAAAFRSGGGVPPSAYPSRVWPALERCTAPVYEHVLVQMMIPAMPEVQAMLARGADLPDIGCGHGRALIKLAQAFPRSRFVGYDVYGPATSQAAANAEAAGVAERVRFVERDAIQGIPAQYDVITTFGVVHDAVDPLGLIRAIRQALRPNGTYILEDFGGSAKLEENIGPGGTFMYSFSVLYCMTMSLAQGGAGLGTAGLPEQKVRELCAAAGFASVRKVPLKDSTVYEVKP
jgi:SAM-dependent methyltransferase